MDIHVLSAAVIAGIVGIGIGRLSTDPPGEEDVTNDLGESAEGHPMETLSGEALAAMHVAVEAERLTVERDYGKSLATISIAGIAGAAALRQIDVIGPRMATIVCMLLFGVLMMGVGTLANQHGILCRRELKMRRALESNTPFVLRIPRSEHGIRPQKKLNFASFMFLWALLTVLSAMLVRTAPPCHNQTDWRGPDWMRPLICSGVGQMLGR